MSIGLQFAQVILRSWHAAEIIKHQIIRTSNEKKKKNVLAKSSDKIIN